MNRRAELIDQQSKQPVRTELNHEEEREDMCLCNLAWGLDSRPVTNPLAGKRRRLRKRRADPADHELYGSSSKTITAHAT